MIKAGKRPLAALATALGLWAAVPSGTALAQDIRPGDAVEARLLEGWRTADGRHMTALLLTLAPGWKTYWRAPGEGGIAPRFSWQGSRNLGSVTEHWPRPAIYVISGVQSLGFTRELVLPLEISALDPDAPVHLRADVDIGVCEQVCMPVSLHLETDLVREGTRDPRILRALADAPMSAAEAGVHTVRCRVEPIADGMRVTAHVALPPLGEGGETAVFELPDPDVWIGTAETRREGGTLIATSDIVSYDGGLALDRSAMRLTLIGDERAVDIRGCTTG